MLVGITLIAVTYFIAYDITEDRRIRDWAYRDIGGYLAGFTIVITVLVGAWAVWGGA